MTDGNLLFRRQFLLTPVVCSSLSRWQHIRIGNDHLYAHPDLQVSALSSADGKVTVALVGYIIDPDHPERTDAQILRTLAGWADSVAGIADYLESVGGRFVLLLKTPDDTLLFHDPCGLRTAYYTKYEGGIFVGSQPNIFRRIIPLKKGMRFSSYNGSPYALGNLEHWIPSGCSLFEDVGHLVPNHYLRFSTLEQIRYWPRGKLTQKPTAEAATAAADLLRRLMRAASHRFRLALTVTAGWDSRLILSATKTIADDIYFYTLQYRNLNPQSDDIKIPSDLLRSLGLRHHLLDCRKTASAEFRETYQKNSSPTHMHDWGEIAFGMLDTYPPERICVKGSCAEITRCWHFPKGTHPPVVSTDQLLALEPGWAGIPFIREYFSSWFGEAGKVAADTGMDILDLFYWEQKMGGWQAQSQLEWDIVQETFSPFNHRGLLQLMLAVPPEFRCAPDYAFHKMMLHIMWPEVMRRPINPAEAKARLFEVLFARRGLLKKGPSGTPRNGGTPPG